MTVNGADVNTAVTFTPKIEKVVISTSTQKVGDGPEIIMRATGGGNKNIGVTCNLTTTAQGYIDNTGNTVHPQFQGWWKNGVCVSMDVFYSFTVIESALFVARWSWN